MLLVSGETGESTEPFPTAWNKVRIAKVAVVTSCLQFRTSYRNETFITVSARV
jgi:hypothetical protein